MRKRIRSFVPPLFATFLALSIGGPAVFAQASNPRVSLFGGVSLLGGNRTFVVGNDLYGASYANGGKVGFRVSANLNDHWGAEGAYTFSTNDLQISNITLSQKRTFNQRAHQFAVNAMYFVSTTEAMIRPFGTLGLGFTHFGLTGSATALAAQQFVDVPAVIQGENKIALNFGGGVEVKPWDHWGIRADLRDFVSGVPHYGLPEIRTSPGAPFFPVTGTLNRIEMSVGVVYYLGQ